MEIIKIIKAWANLIFQMVLGLAIVVSISMIIFASIMLITHLEEFNESPSTSPQVTKAITLDTYTK